MKKVVSKSAAIDLDNSSKGFIYGDVNTNADVGISAKNNSEVLLKGNIRQKKSSNKGGMLGHVIGGLNIIATLLSSSIRSIFK